MSQHWEGGTCYFSENPAASVYQARTAGSGYVKFMQWPLRHVPASTFHAHEAITSHKWLEIWIIT